MAPLPRSTPLGKGLPVAELAALALLATFVPGASGQEDGCTQATPCEWVAAVDQEGFPDEGFWEDDWTAGDWFVLLAANDDEVAHTVSIPEAGVSLTVAAGEDMTSEPFQVQEGSITLEDRPSGDAVSVLIVAEDSVANDEFAQDGESGKTPGPGMFVGLGVLAAAAMLRRR